MSRETKSVETESDARFEGSLIELFGKWYDLPALAILTAFMLWVRIQGLSRFTSNGEVLFSGNDAYYHYRNVQYTVQHWPWTMDFDPWTQFPFGTSTGQFGTLFDQIIATAALIVGLGSPTEHTVAMTTVVAPAVFGAMAAVPVYYIGQRLGGRLGGLFGVLVLALLPGTFLQRSLVGFADHQVAEVFFQALAVALFMMAVWIAERELPVYEQFLDRDWEGLKTPVSWSAAAGVAIALYMWVWPPGIVLVGIIGIFFTIALTIDFVRGRSPEHLALVGVVSMAATFLLLLVQLDGFGFSATSITLLQLILTLGVAAGCVFMAALARVWNAQGIDDRYYPATIGGILVVGVALMSVLTPRLFSVVVRQLERSLLFAQDKGTLTIAEAQSVVPQGPGVTVGQQIATINGFMYGEYGMAYVTAYVALIWLIGHLYLRDYRAEDVFVIVYMVFTTLMALTQVRFNYYLVIPIAAMNAWLFGQVVDLVGVPTIEDSLDDVEIYQVLTIAAVLILVVAPLIPPLAAANAGVSQQQGIPTDVVTAGDAYARPSGGQWADTGNWMVNNTPEMGKYGGANNELDYYGSFERQDDFAYPEGSYGVLSWWDYGHWITVLGERAPVANPFQQNPRAASAFFQAQSEDEANLILETLPAMQGRTGEYDDLSTQELRQIEQGMSDQQDSEDTRYVMIDDQTAAGKFYAVVQWSGPASEEGVQPQSVYMRGQRFRIGNQNTTLSVTNDRYANTMLYELYYQDGQGLEHYRLVHEQDSYSVVGGLLSGQQDRALASFNFGPWRPNLGNISRQLDTYRRFGRAAPTDLNGDGQNEYIYNAHVESSLKTYERVPGATVEGTVADATENTSVVVTVNMETSSGRTFRYTQQATTDAQGNFNVTVPYSTNNEVGVAEGGTNESVQATGEYSVFVLENGRPIGQADTTFAVPESAVYDGGTIDAGTIEMPEQNTGNQSGGRVTAPALSDGPVTTTTAEDLPAAPAAPSLSAPTADAGVRIAR